MNKVPTARGDYLVSIFHLFVLRPTTGQVWHKAFFLKWVWTQGHSPHAPGKVQKYLRPRQHSPNGGAPRLGNKTAYFTSFTIVSNIFIRNGTYPLMFIGWVYKNIKNGTYPLMFIGWVYKNIRNGIYPLMFRGWVYKNIRNGMYPLMFIVRVYNNMRNGTYPLMFTGRVYKNMRNGTYPLMFIGWVYNTYQN